MQEISFKSDTKKLIVMNTMIRALLLERGTTSRGLLLRYMGFVIQVNSDRTLGIISMIHCPNSTMLYLTASVS